MLAAEVDEAVHALLQQHQVVVAAVLPQAVQDQGCGRSLLRLSARRLHDAEVEAALGELAARAARVSILWNEREGEIIRVLEESARLAA